MSNLNLNENSVNSKTVVLNNLYNEIIQNEDVTKQTVMVDEFVNLIEEHGINSIMNLNLKEKIITSLSNKPNFSIKRGIILICHQLQTKLKEKFEPYLFSFIESLIDLLDDNKTINQMINTFLTDFGNHMNPYATIIILPILFKKLKEFSWKIKVGCLSLISVIAQKATTQIGNLLPIIVPQITEYFWDTKYEVKQAAKEALTACCNNISNPDVKPIIPILISANGNPKETNIAIDKLMGTTFVSQVDKQTLSIIVPLMNRGLKDRDVQVNRKCAVVIDNMCKLVCSESDVEPFVDKLLPQLTRVAEEVPIPEIREYGQRAKETLLKAINNSEINK